MSTRTRKYFSGPFKATVALEAIRAIKTVNEIAQEYGVHPAQVGQWKRICTNRPQTSRRQAWSETS